FTDADDALDPVLGPDRLDASGEDGEERSLVARVRCVLARCEADVGCGAGEPLAIGRAERSEDHDATDLVRRHHRGGTLLARPGGGLVTGRGKVDVVLRRSGPG